METTSTLDYLIPIISGTVLFGLLTVFIVYFVILSRKNQIHFEFEREKLKSELLTVKMEIKEDTLNSVSRELHDNYGHTAVLIKLNMSLIQTGNLTPDDQLKLEETIDMTHTLIRDIKSFSKSINGEAIKELGWLKMVQYTVDGINRMKMIQFNYAFDSAADIIAEDSQVILFRIVQEMISNTIKHANSSRIDLHITGNDDGIVVLYKDNGCGFDVNSPHFKPGSGLKNIMERCEIIGANCILKSTLTKGVEFQIELNYG